MTNYNVLCYDGSPSDGMHAPETYTVSCQEELVDSVLYDMKRQEENGALPIEYAIATLLDDDGEETSDGLVIDRDGTVSPMIWYEMA